MRCNVKVRKIEVLLVDFDNDDPKPGQYLPGLEAYKVMQVETRDLVWENPPGEDPENTHPLNVGSKEERLAVYRTLFNKQEP